ncbi:retrovirus-related pol polyprotein from transposon TNT 1-94 [Tanacetum coccineum]|uniref:Retrovirus-related pol polyprotein from transposon TNT 1-94 n=1 Tax=Tanacetum coccineum TaxID=301880 RepID=A0ABQ5FDP4_9ASTR
MRVHEFLKPRNDVTQCPGNTKYVPYILAYEITTPSETPILHESIIPEDPPVFTEADNHPVINEPDQTESTDLLEPPEPQTNVIYKPISDVQPSPSAEVIPQTLVPQDRWVTKEKTIETCRKSLVNPCGIYNLTLKAFRIFLAYAAYMGFMVYQIDVKSAFLNEKISEEVYVQQPPGFESSEFPNHVCKLDKALYGLKQAPRAWYERVFR